MTVLSSRLDQVTAPASAHSLPRKRSGLFAALLTAILTSMTALSLGGCTDSIFSQVYQRGYIPPEGALEQVPLGAPQEQVLIVLGTPSTVATVSGEGFYYISARTQQTSFLPERTVDQRVVAVYFDKSRRVERLADYGLKDGKIFDYIGRVTPSGGVEQNYLAFVFKIANF